MKKRLRKKLRAGEFTVYGAAYDLTLNAAEDLENLIGDIVEFVEDNGGTYAGGYSDSTIARCFVELGTTGEDPAGRRVAVLEWLKKHAAIASVNAGELEDSAEFFI